MRVGRREGGKEEERKEREGGRRGRREESIYGLPAANMCLGSSAITQGQYQISTLFSETQSIPFTLNYFETLCFGAPNLRNAD